MYKKKKTQSKSKSKKTAPTAIAPEADRKFYGACEHEQPNYKGLEKFFDQLFKAHKMLIKDNERKGKHLDEIKKFEKKKIKKLNKDWSDREAHHDAQIFILRDRLKRVEQTYIKKLTEQKENFQKEIDYERSEAVKINNDVMAKNDDCIKKNTQLLKSHNEITRAYNGLHTMGKFAEEEGIDIKEHCKQLPENMEFHQSHELMESGRVKHVYGIKKKNKKKNGETK